MSKATCSTCKHFVFLQGEEGICRRNPPSAFPMPGDKVTSIWPPVSVGANCGEYAVALEIATELPAAGLLSKARMQ